MTRAKWKLLTAAAAAGLLLACLQVPPAPLSPGASADRLQARSFDDPALRDFLEQALGHPQVGWPVGPWDLDALTGAALFFQPRLDVARAHWDVARAAIETARARPNPTLALTPERVFNPDPGLGPWIAAVQVDWPVETAHKREHRAARAEAAASAARRAVAAEAWQVRRALRDALIELAAARARAVVGATQADTAGAIVALLEERVRAGADSRAALLPARLAARQAAVDLADARRRERTARAGVAAAIGVPLPALDPIEIDFALDAAADPSAALPDAEARRAALLGRADVLAALDDYAASEAELRLQLARQIPDLHLGPGYQFDQSQDKWSLGVSLEVPLFDRHQGPIAEARAARAESAARFLALQAQVLAEVEQAEAELRGAEERAEQLEALLEAQRAERARVAAAFALGAVDRIADLGGELEQARALALRIDGQQILAQARSALEAAVQGPLAPAPAYEQPVVRAAAGAAP